jgi:hypothetical protein
MKATIKIYRNDGEAENGYPVKLILSHNRKTRRKTIAHAKKGQWDDFNQLPTPYHPDYDHLYDLVNDMRKQSQQRKFKSIDSFEVAFECLRNQKEIVNRDFYTIAQERIQYMYNLKRIGNAEAYEQAVIELKKLFPVMPMHDFNKARLIQFKEWKKSQGASNATVKKYLSELRAIYNSGVDLGHYQDEEPFKGVFKGLKVQIRRAKIGYLLRCCLNVLDSLEDLTPAQRRSVDLGMLQFYLGGASFVDVYLLKWEYIQNSRVYFPYREKMKDERGAPYDVKIFECAWEIINKYKDEDSEYVFPWRKTHSGIKDFRGNMNDDLKLIQKRYNIKVHPTNINLTTSIFRKSFGTIGKFAGFSEDILRELMGHEREETDNAYKDVFPEFERDLAQQKIIG